MKQLSVAYKLELVDTFNSLVENVGEEAFIYNPEFLGYLIIKIYDAGYEYAVRTIDGQRILHQNRRGGITWQAQCTERVR